MRWLKKLSNFWRESKKEGLPPGVTKIERRKALKYPVTISAKERKERLRESYVASHLRVINTIAGMDWILECPDFNQEEKDYLLFNIHRLDEIAEMRITKFREEVIRHREEMEKLDA